MNDTIPAGAIPIRIFFHCGWAIVVTQDFESEQIEAGETLRIYGPQERREIFLSSMILKPHDGKPFRTQDVLPVFPPADMTGLRYEHNDDDFAGSALWFFGDDDLSGPAWVLMAIVISEQDQKIARCTIVCTDEADLDWALDTWQSVRRETPELSALKGRTVIIREI